ncbi:MAG: formyltransferase, partial [Deltaproteobacteria bacterium]|nr:formyltransferase [Deltaproteobacteria bacterium]
RADAGDIVAQRRIEIAEDDTALTLYHKLVPLGASLIREYHPLIVAGLAPRRIQDLTAGSYFGRRRPEDGRIDWNWPARRIFNLVRGVTHPYPGAFCFVQGCKLTVWEARVARDKGKWAESGRIIRSIGGAVEVAAGDGSLLILRSQLEGEAETDATTALSQPAVARTLRLE